MSTDGSVNFHHSSNDIEDMTAYDVQGMMPCPRGQQQCMSENCCGGFQNQDGTGCDEDDECGDDGEEEEDDEDFEDEEDEYYPESMQYEAVNQ